MTLQNRVRAIVCVAILLSAFVVFVPSGKNTSDTDLAKTDTDVSPDLTWHDQHTEDKHSNRRPSSDLDSDEEIRPLFFSDSGFQESPDLAVDLDSKNKPAISGESSSLLPFRNSQQNSNRRDLRAGQQVSQRLTIERPTVTRSFQGNLRSYRSDIVSIDYDMDDREMDDRENDLYDIDSISHTIAPGETLQSISKKYFGHPNEYLYIYEFNADTLSEPINLPSGVRIQIPRSR